MSRNLQRLDDAQRVARGLGAVLLEASLKSSVIPSGYQADAQKFAKSLLRSASGPHASAGAPASRAPTEAKEHITPPTATGTTSASPTSDAVSINLSSPATATKVDDIQPHAAPTTAPPPPPPVAATSNSLHVSAPASLTRASADQASSFASRDPSPSTPTTSATAATPEPPPAAVAEAKPTGAAGARRLREVRVPATPLQRVVGFGSLTASLAWGAFSDSVQRTWRGEPSPAELARQRQEEGGVTPLLQYNAFLNEKNAERLALGLCRMRGAALKLGQMLSIQDENIIPPQIAAALERVRAGADVMPQQQLYDVMTKELGPQWRERVKVFHDEPMAAASIGQVHRAELHDGRHVAMKIQYPGVAQSINSDVDNLMRLVSMTAVLPPGLYVEDAVQVAKDELADECDYVMEQRSQERYRRLLGEDPMFRVPATVPELCSAGILTSELMPGVQIDQVAGMDQATRDRVGTEMLRLTLMELFDWGFMQTDPNWGNFLYDAASGQLVLIDFGAARAFEPDFVDHYLRMVKACGDRDAETVLDASTKLGFLTGDESQVMLDAHCEAGFIVGTPFAHEGDYHFTRGGSMTKDVAEKGEVMLKHRLSPPPREAYSLHRKLSGAFLACMKLGARVPCRRLLLDAYARHRWTVAPPTVGAAPSLSPDGHATTSSLEEPEYTTPMRVAA